MNTYSENLRQTVVDTLSSLSTLQGSVDSSQVAAEYTLYHAQGAEITARDKVGKTDDEVKTWHHINEQSLIDENKVYNLLATATEANTDVTASVTNTATAASNVQIASNAISALASDIGAALNIANAALYDTDVYDKIQNANSFIIEVANEARLIAKSAMKASAATSEITTSEVLAQTSSLKSKIDNIFKSTQAEWDKFAKQAIAEGKVVNSTSQAERQAEGALDDADKEVAAIDKAYRFANDQMNHMLEVTVTSATEISVSFGAWSAPSFYSPAAAGVKIPQQQVENYFLVLLPAQNQAMFSIDQAQQLFVQNPLDNTKTFIPATPDAKVGPTGKVERKPTPVTLSEDINGDPIQPGASYVAYIYVELTKQYKQFTNNYSDLLFAPSQSFTPAETLPSPNGLKEKWVKTDPKIDLSWLNLQFQATPMCSSQKIEHDKQQLELDKAAYTEAEDKAKASASELESLRYKAATANEEYQMATKAADSAHQALQQDESQAKEAEQKLEAANTAQSTATEKASKADVEAIEADAKALKDPTQENIQAAKEATENALLANAELEAANQKVKSAEEQLEVANRTVEHAREKFSHEEKIAQDKEAAFNEAEQLVNKEKAQVADDSKAALAAWHTYCATQALVKTDELLVSADVKYRAILVPASLNPLLDFKLSPENNNPPVYFNLAIAEQVCPANFVTADPASSQPKGSKEQSYEIQFDGITTDCFGNMIEPNAKYRIYILSIADSDRSNCFVNTLSSPAVLTICKSKAA